MSKLLNVFTPAEILEDHQISTIIAAGYDARTAQRIKASAIHAVQTEWELHTTMPAIVDRLEVYKLVNIPVRQFDLNYVAGALFHHDRWYNLIPARCSIHRLRTAGHGKIMLSLRASTDKKLGAYALAKPWFDSSFKDERGEA